MKKNIETLITSGNGEVLTEAIKAKIRDDLLAKLSDSSIDYQVDAAQIYSAISV